MKLRSKRGFTLMEILIAVAIIAVLVAIAIPVFSGQLSKSRQRTCEANRRTLTQEVLTYQLSEGTAAAQTYAPQAASEMTCPSGGTISATVADDGALTIACSRHRSGDALVGTYPARDNLFPILETITASRVDSHSKNGSNIAAIRDQLDALNLSENGIATWSFYNGYDRKVLMWSTVDIAELKYGDTVPILQYNTRYGVYSVWQTTVQPRYDNGEKYPVLAHNGTEYQLSAQADMSVKADFANAVTWYNQLLDQWMEEREG